MPKKDPLEQLAWYLDEAFRIPGTRIRVGWDAIIGLVPGLGETIMLFIQSGLVVMAVSREQVPAIVAVRMVLNVLLDSIVGSLPLIGDVFDAFFKANTRNIQLIREVRAQRSGQKVSRARHYVFVFAVVGALALTILASLALVVFILTSLWRFIQTGNPTGGWA